MSLANRCLSDEELTSLIRGLDLGDRRNLLMLHLDRCPGCRMVLAEAARHVSSRGFASPGRWPRVAAAACAILLGLLALWIFATP